MNNPLVVSKSQMVSMLHSINETDPRVAVTDLNADIWLSHAGQYHPQRIKAAVVTYYGTNQTKPIDAYEARRLIQNQLQLEQSQQAAQQASEEHAAIEAGTPVTPESIPARIRESDWFKAEMEEGERRRANRLAQRGINPTPRFATDDELVEWSRITGRTPQRHPTYDGDQHVVRARRRPRDHTRGPQPLT